jgi:hypothetical protein
MADYSLVPVDHQPEFVDTSFIPVDHNPFSADNASPQLQVANDPQRVMLRADRSNIDAPPTGDLAPTTNTGSRMSGSIIPVCFYANKQEHAGLGFTTCNYHCFNDVDASQTFPYGTKCPGIIRMPGG